jgi:hypothetical protein
MKNAKITTIKLESETKARLNKLKAYKKETYEEVIQKILHILNICKAEPYKARKLLSEIDATRKNFRRL